MDGTSPSDFLFSKAHCCFAPSAQAGASTGVPTFTAIASMPSTTPIALRVYLQTPHARMPDLHLSRDETDNLIAYILSLRGH